MFTQKCILRKNTPELRSYLVSIGYKDCVPLNSVDNRKFGLLLNKKTICGVVQDEEFVFNLDTYLGLNPDIIDCGTNEEMFKAIAALRDDIDKHQWFIYNSMDCTVENLRDFYWFKCEEDKIEDMMYWDCAYLNCTKATVEEIIEHFKSPICQEIGD
jgi:hypothetical protein